MARSSEVRTFWKGIGFISPWIIGFLVFTALPVALSFYYSFCDYTLLQKPVFIGLRNYVALFHDDVFVKVLKNSLIYAAMALPLGQVLPIAVALLLNSNVKGRSIFRTIVFIPSLVPTVASAMLWLWLFNDKLGLINHFLGILHIPGPGWLTTETWVIPAMVMMSLWGVGNTVVIYLAGLQDVPRELYEAADLDGAGPWNRLINVTLPMISPVIFFNLIMALIGVLQVFDGPYIMTHGGPARASYFFTMYLYDNGFTYLKMGYASAMAWIQLLIVLAMTGTAFWSSKKWVHYQGK